MAIYFGKNHHANVTKNNLSLANHLINYTFNKLLGEAGDEDIDALILKYTTVVKDWNHGFTAWRSAFDAQVAATVEMRHLLEILIQTKAPDWVVKVWNVYPEGSVKAKLLVPHARKPFITGSVLDKITGISTFIEKLTGEAALAAVKTDAETFLTDLTAMNVKHNKAKKALSDCSKKQNLLRISGTNALLGIEGALIAKYCETPELVDNYFAVTAMRRHDKKKLKSDGYTVFLLPDEIKLLELHFIGKEIWEVTNNGDFEACIFFGNTSTITTIPATKMVILQGESLQIDLSTLSDDMRFAYAANMSDETEGELNILQIA
ncbi:MAG: hypothetical protein WCL06_15955 [Bacteroidota bacterium]